MIPALGRTNLLRKWTYKSDSSVDLDACRHAPPIFVVPPDWVLLTALSGAPPLPLLMPAVSGPYRDLPGLMTGNVDVCYSVHVTRLH